MIKSPNDCASLQNGLYKVVDWLVAHQLPICTKMLLYCILGNVIALNTVYNIGEQPIDRVGLSEVCDLGIIVDSLLKFTSHINSTVAEANGRAALIHKCFVLHNPDVMVRAFKVYVRPMLQYAVCQGQIPTKMWSPRRKMWSPKLKNV